MSDSDRSEVIDRPNSNPRRQPRIDCRNRAGAPGPARGEDVGTSPGCDLDAPCELDRRVDPRPKVDVLLDAGARAWVDFELIVSSWNAELVVLDRCVGTAAD